MTIPDRPLVYDHPLSRAEVDNAAVITSLPLSAGHALDGRLGGHHRPGVTVTTWTVVRPVRERACAE